MTQLAMPPEGVTLRGLRRVEFERMVETGLFVGEPIELLGGELIEMSPQGVAHGWAIEELTSQLAPLIAQGYAVRVQLPLAVDEESLPEPDVAVTDRSGPSGHPATAHAVIEVAATSQRYDLDHKAPRYAVADVPLYVVLDLRSSRAVVHREPVGGRYATTATLGPEGTMDVLGVPIDLRRILGEG